MAFTKEDREKERRSEIGKEGEGEERKRKRSGGRQRKREKIGKEMGEN